MARGKKTAEAAVAQTGMLDQFDLEAFRRQRDQITQAAYSELALRVEKIQILIQDMKDIVELTGVKIGISDLISELQDARYELDPYWNSSGC